MEYKKKLYIAPKINAIVVTMESALLQGSETIYEKGTIDDMDGVI